MSKLTRLPQTRVTVIVHTTAEDNAAGSIEIEHLYKPSVTINFPEAGTDILGVHGAIKTHLEEMHIRRAVVEIEFSRGEEEPELYLFDMAEIAV